MHFKRMFLSGRQAFVLFFASIPISTFNYLTEKYKAEIWPVLFRYRNTPNFGQLFSAVKVIC
jgi:hypothetical protein